MRYLTCLVLALFISAPSFAAQEIEQERFNNIRTLEFLAEGCIQSYDKKGLEFSRWADDRYYRIHLNSRANNLARVFEGEANNLWSPTRVVNNIVLSMDKYTGLCRVFGSVDYVEDMPLLIKDFILANKFLFQEEWDESELDIAVSVLTQNTHKYDLLYRVSSGSFMTDHIIKLTMYRTHPEINLAISYEKGLAKKRIDEMLLKHEE